MWLFLNVLRTLLCSRLLNSTRLFLLHFNKFRGCFKTQNTPLVTACGTSGHFAIVLYVICDKMGSAAPDVCGQHLDLSIDHHVRSED